MSDGTIIVPPGKATGLIPRDYKSFPVGYAYYAPAFPDSELIPKNEWKDRLAEKRANRSGLLDFRKANYGILKSLDQNGFGLCWAFSTTKTVMYMRAFNNLPAVLLSAWFVAGKINRWADRGGWNHASLEFIVKYGVPPMDKCPEYDRRYDTPEVLEAAADYKITEWWDGSDDPELAQQQLVSSLLRGVACAVDLNVMGHSMCAVDLDSVDPVTVVYDNSWGDSGDQGLYRGKGAYARPNGLVVPRVTMACVV